MLTYLTMSSESVIASILADLKKGKSFERCFSQEERGWTTVSLTYNFGAETFVKKTIAQDENGHREDFSERLDEARCKEEIRRLLSSK